MTRLTLTQRILTVIFAIQLMLLVALAVASLETLRASVAAELRAGVETARSLVLATVGTMQGAVPPDRLMATLPERLVLPRNTEITVLDARDGSLSQPVSGGAVGGRAPDWFARLIAPEPQQTRLPVVIGGRRLGYVYIAPNPAAQIATAWQDMRRTIGLTALAALLQGALIVWLTRRALRPVDGIAARLTDLTQGRLAARVGPLPQPDLAPIGRGVDQLGAALEQARADRENLQRQVVTRADDERKAIARDLHDEMGPCLFGLRVEADALRSHAGDPAIRDHAESIAAIADQIGRVNRALLDDLRPAPLGQLPLATVLAGHVEDLAARFPGTELAIDLPPDLPEPDEATALTLFRILQEGTTNALRHAGASRITATLRSDPAHWIMTVSDDGRGIPAGTPRGTGLSGMAERIALLAGGLDIRSDRTGTTLTAELPRGRNR
ncbi:MAG: histidine kinase [Paracoccus sp. (in: a-proteobacteria)]